MVGLRRRHSAAAIRAQWQDARDFVLQNRSAGSEALRDYIADRGWL